MYDLVEPSRLHQRAEIARSLASMYAELAAPQEGEKFSLLRAVERLARGELQSGTCHEANINQAAQLAQGEIGYNPNRLVVPWGALGQRNLQVSTPSAGGNLVETRVTDAMDVLRPHSVIARLGVTTLDQQTGNLALPSVTGEAEGEWLAGEGSSLTPGAVTLGAVTGAPKTGGAIVKASFNFMKQGRNAEVFLRRHLLGVVGGMIDRAILQGSGASGEPTGLLYASDVWEDEDDTFEALNATGMECAVTEANADDEKLRWVVHPSMRQGMRLKEWGDWPRSEAWRNGGMLEIPGFVTSNCPMHWIFLGDWSHCVVAFWGAGIEIEIDPYTDFQSGVIGIRALVAMDAMLSKPGAFARFHIPAVV